MATSTDPGHFFQTDAAHSTSARKAAKSTNTSGSPIRLPSKLLAVLPDPLHPSSVLVAESAGCLRRVDLDTRDVKADVYRGPQAPLTSIACSTDAHTLYAGCWDKTIWSWSRSTRTPARRFPGHTDFVKAILVAPLAGTDILISAAQDATIRVFDTATGATLHALAGHPRGVLCLALLPTSATDNLTLFSGDSAREIRRWRVTRATAEPLDAAPLLAHETSINALTFQPTDEEPALWTASSDRTARRLVLSPPSTYLADTTLPHPDFVRAALPLPGGALVATACRDEHVRVWDADAVACVQVFRGHYDEVAGLCVVGERLVSVGLDGTVRVWPANVAGVRGWREVEAEGEEGEGVELEEDEERELAELMAEEE